MSIAAINVRNQFRGKIKEIIHGPVVSEVDVDTPAGIITAVITTRSIKDLQLVPGSEVLALVKATEVSIAKLFTGLRTGLSLAWMFLVAAELIAATRGLGYLLIDGRETGRADLVIVAIIVLALLGKLSDSLLQWLEHRLLSWRDTFDSRPS